MLKFKCSQRYTQNKGEEKNVRIPIMVFYRSIIQLISIKCERLVLLLKVIIYNEEIVFLNICGLN